MSESDGEAVEEGGENPNLRHMREKAERTDAAEAAHAALQREVAFLKAGIDTDSKLGKLLYKSYDGDLSDIEALKTEAAELGALKGSTPVEPESEEVSEPTGSNERRALAQDAPADEPSEKHPFQAAQDAYSAAMERQGTWEEAAGEYVHTLAAAAMSGDQRAVVVDRRG